MVHDTTPGAQAALTADFLRSSACLVDNLFADLWKQLGMATLLARSGFRKRSGLPAGQVVYCLLMWAWLKTNSVALFARESMGSFTAGAKDVLYEAMNREDWNWRGLHQRVALKALRQLEQTNEVDTARAFVLDDTIKIRHGKKMPGISRHFDHTTGRSVMGQQMLTLGLSCAQGFVPLDGEL